MFCKRILQADETAALLESLFPGKIGRYHSGMTKMRRKETLELFSMRELRILVACKALDEGLDVPDASVGIILSGTSVGRQRVQRLGRILRMMPEKSMAYLYYLYIAQSTEESAHLPGIQPDFPVFHLHGEFGSDGQLLFAFPVYEKAAEAILNRIRRTSPDTLRSGLSESGPHSAEKASRSNCLYAEMLRCISEGLLRPDFLLQEADLQRRIRESRSVHERNYWLVIKELKAGMMVNYSYVNGDHPRPKSDYSGSDHCPSASPRS